MATRTRRFTVSVNHYVSEEMLENHPRFRHPYVFGHDPDDPEMPTSCIIGREFGDPTVGVVVQGKDVKRVSRRHLIIHSNNGELFVSNLSTTNPTFRNSSPIDSDKPTWINPREDLIQFGELSLEFRRVSPSVWTAVILPAARHPMMMPGGSNRAALQLGALAQVRDLFARGGAEALLQSGDLAQRAPQTFGDQNRPVLEVIVKVSPIKDPDKPPTGQELPPEVALELPAAQKEDAPAGGPPVVPTVPDEEVLPDENPGEDAK